jgi:hypothetical protein
MHFLLLSFIPNKPHQDHPMYKMLIYSRDKTTETPKSSDPISQEQHFGPKEFYTRVRVLGMERKEVVLMWHHFPAKSRQAPLKNILLI